ncbi:VOC family protein [Bacillaceae bacterium CLA-AA-H227]|uniref:VOC family protein n=1 Tax=Robertmurraya yapensis (ex Hitch et al 2024) TaxID=3133160 RepID=A0ACC6SGY5_9BACI
MEIKSVILQSNHIEKMKQFYVERFGFPLINEDENSFRIVVGTSELEFTSQQVEGNPYYHFAFNIPSNLFAEAKEWVKERVTLNIDFDNDEIYFSNFSAYSLYFSDPAGNIVELIARQSLAEVGEGPFSIKSIMNISEIGLTVDDAIDTCNRLMEIGIHEREHGDLTSTSLNFMGEMSKGVFIIVNQPGRRWIFSDKKSAIFPLEITTMNERRIVVTSEKQLEIF